MKKVVFNAPWNLGRVDEDVLQEMHMSLSLKDPLTNPTAQYNKGEVHFRHCTTPIFKKFVSVVLEPVIEKELAFSSLPLLTVTPERILVPPGETSKVVASNWHSDSRRAVVSSALPTEFLVGEAVMPSNNNSYPYSYINSDAFKNIEPNLVYTPNSGDITGFDMSHIHRASVNTSGEYIDRMFVQVFASS